MSPKDINCNSLSKGDVRDRDNVQSNLMNSEANSVQYYSENTSQFSTY